MSKQYEEIDKQINVLKQRGIKFKDEEKAKKIILRENFHYLTTGYEEIFLDLRRSSNNKEIYEEETYFEELYAIYKLDRELKNVIFDYINIVESNIKSYISYEFSARYGNMNFFKRENFELFLKTLEAFLIDENRRFGVKEYEKRAKKFIAILLLKDIKKLKTELKNLNENSQNSDFHAIRIKIKNLRYALEYFTSTFNQKSLNELSKISKRSQEIFGNLQDIDLWLKFIQIYQNSLKNQNEISTFLCSFERLILGHSVKIKQNILENKAKFIKILNKNIKFLKIYKEI